MLWPELRYPGALGRAPILMQLFWGSGLDVGRLLPSYIPPGPPRLAPVLAVLALGLLAGLILRKTAGGDPPRGAVAWGLVGAVGLAVALGGYAWWRPYGPYPTVIGEGQGGAAFRGHITVAAADGGVALKERLVWTAQRDGRLELAPRLPRGRYRLVLRAGGSGPAGGPTLTLRAGSAPAYRVTLDAASPPAWREREYVYELTWDGGRLPIRIELTEVSRGGPPRLAYLDSLGIQRLDR